MRSAQARRFFAMIVGKRRRGPNCLLVLTSAERQRIAERWLAEARVARDTAQFTLPLSMMNVGAGDVVRLPDLNGDGLFRIDQSEQTDRQTLEAVRIEPAIYEPQDVTEKTFGLRNFTPPPFPSNWC